jgi:hypothetical protein
MVMDWSSIRHVIFERDGLALTWAAFGGAAALVASVVLGVVSDWWRRRQPSEGPSRWRAMLANMRPPYRPHRPGWPVPVTAAGLWATAVYTLTVEMRTAVALAAGAFVTTVVDLARRLRWARWLERREVEAAKAYAARTAVPETADRTDEVPQIEARTASLRPVTVIAPRRFPDMKGRTDG